MKYYLGHWQVRTLPFAHVGMPVGAIGCLDLGKLPEMAVTAERVGCLCWTDGSDLPSEYTLLGEGDLREVMVGDKQLSAFESLVGYRPHGSTLLDCVYDALIGGADIDGAVGPKPLVPNTRRQLELYLPRHGLVKREKFDWGTHRQSAVIQDALRKQFEAEWERTNGSDQVLKVLDYTCNKYGVSDWREFVPTKLHDEVPGRIPHETTITENFNTADSSTLGPTLTWSEVTGDASIVSNECNCVSTSTNVSLRAQSDLSGADHYSQIVVTSLGSSEGAVAACARFSGSAQTFYMSNLEDLAEEKLAIYKCEAGSFTQLDFTDSLSVAMPKTIRIDCNGSTISDSHAGVGIHSLTDTTISGGTRCGLNLYRTSGTVTADDFIAADLAVSGNPHNYYAQQQ